MDPTTRAPSQHGDTPATDSRDTRIDAAKGVAILLVVLGHAKGVPQAVTLLAYSFHVPLFFFLSGWLSRPPGTRSIRDTTARLARSLLWPYAVFFIAGYAYWLLTRHMGEKALRWGHLPWWDPLIGGLTGIGPKLYVHPALWFLPTLFTTALAYLLLARRLHAGAIALLALPLVLLWTMTFPHAGVRLPFGLDVLPVALFFFACGAFCVRAFALPQSATVGMSMAAVVALPWLWLAWSNGRVDINQLRFGVSAWKFILASLSGSAIVLLLSPLAARSAALCWIGRNTLLILCTHILVFFVLSGIASVLGWFPEGRKPGPAWALGVSIVAVALCVPMRAVVMRHAPWVLGMRRRAAPVPA